MRGQRRRQVAGKNALRAAVARAEELAAVRPPSSGTRATRARSAPQRKAKGARKKGGR